MESAGKAEANAKSSSIPDCMAHHRTAYELSESQVTTPEPVVSLFWRLAKKYRKHLASVLDLGAGDGRFATGGTFDRYIGVEIDGTKTPGFMVGKNCKILQECAFRHQAGNYDACIGNPPYARHHDIQSPWKESTVSRLEDALDVSIDKHCNLYTYFFFLALMKSRGDGLVALVIPYEWVSRPSADSLREYIKKQKWSVSVYRFQDAIFDGVMTTASISIVDKASNDGAWKYYDITSDYRVVPRAGVVGSRRHVLDYEKRGKIWGLRGLSPGTQKVFTLTDGERIRSGLRKHDVVPCVTTLRMVPRSLRDLSRETFEKYFVKAGERCWLIRSDKERRSAELDAYLESIPEKDRDTYTCRNQTPWYKYLPHPIPQLLFSSGFTTFGPKVLVNSIGARAVGSVWGIHSEKRVHVRRLQDFLLDINFEELVVAHAHTLKKVEVRQLNAVLNRFVVKERRNARRRS